MIADRVENEVLGGEAVEPVPRRYWWLKRISLTGGMLLVGIAGLHFWWAGYVERRWAQVIAEAQAAGEPVLPEDFNAATIADDENAAVLYLRAADMVRDNAELSRLAARGQSPSQLTAETLEEIGRQLDAHDFFFNLLREARERKGLAWPIEYKSPLLNVMLPDLAHSRACAGLLVLKARWAADQGEVGAAISAVRDVYGLADALSAWPSLLAHMHAVAMNHQGALTLEALLPAVGDRLASPDAPAELRREMDALLATLIDEAPLVRGVELAIAMERAMQLDTVSLMVDGTDERELRFVGAIPKRSVTGSAIYGPMFKMAGVRMAKYMAAYIAAVRAPTWPEHVECLANAPEIPTETSGFNGPTGMLASILLPSLGGACKTHYEGLAKRRLTAVAVALRLYEVDRGRRAESLDELVEHGYLPRAPGDPFKLGATLQYAPDAARPLIYSVGRDGKDDSADYVNQVAPIDQCDCDAVLFLDGERPVQPKP